MRKYITPSDFPYFPALLGSTLRKNASALTDYVKNHSVDVPEEVKEFFFTESLHSMAEPIPTWNVSSWYAFARTFKKCKASNTSKESQDVLKKILKMTASALDIRKPREQAV